MGVLKRTEIIDRIIEPNINKRLVITPLLDADEVIASSSIDLRLGTEYILLKKRIVGCLDIYKQDEIKKDIHSYQQRIRIKIRDKFTIHPNQLVLSSNLEYISIPEDLMAYVIGKSTWGRTGLVIATATKVDPGFKGSITLEIVNLGEVPIVLYPGMPIAQLVLHKTEGDGKYEGKYKNPTGPQFPKLGKASRNLDFWLPE